MNLKVSKFGVKLIKSRCKTGKHVQFKPRTFFVCLFETQFLYVERPVLESLLLSFSLTLLELGL